MGDSWATSGLDLHLAVDRRHVRRSVEDSLREAIRSSRLRPGTVLPSSRTLAADLQVARNTVVEVYGQLVAEGWLSAQSGSRTVVADLPQRDALPTVAVPAASRRFPAVQRLDLRPGWPDLADFPRREWARAAHRALDVAPVDAFGYQEPRGRPELREALADYLARTRGLTVSADQILVCLGITHGLGLVAKALRVRGARVFAVEGHSLWVHHEVLGNYGYTLRPMPVDAAGARVDESIDAAAGALLTPGRQFPLGVRLTAQRRADVRRWARDGDRILFEDDYEAEFDDETALPTTLQSEQPDLVVYAGTASKTLAPALRLGWLVLPASLLEEVAAAKGLADGHNSVVDQLTLAELITSGAYDRHVRRCRHKYRSRRHLLEDSLDADSTEQVGRRGHGLHALVGLPEGVTEGQAVARGAELGLTLQGLSDFRYPTADARPPALVIGYAGPSDRDYPECLRRLTALLHQLRREG